MIHSAEKQESGTAGKEETDMIEGEVIGIEVHWYSVEAVLVLEVMSSGLGPMFVSEGLEGPLAGLGSGLSDHIQ
jgi:hypothetical protein